MAREALEVRPRSHHWILVEHKRGVARMCIRCGKLRYYGKHKRYKVGADTAILVYVPEAVALPHGVDRH